METIVNKKWYQSKILRYVIAPIILFIVIGYIILYAFYGTYWMPAESMEDTLMVGDYFFAEKNVSNYDYDDIVIFSYPVDKTTKYVKRIVALPGDTIEIKDKIVFINSVERNEPKTVKHIRDQIQPRRPEGGDSPDNWGPYVVPADHYFMMGDNRDNSQDSRWFRAVPHELMIGKVRMIYKSEDENRVGLVPE